MRKLRFIQSSLVALLLAFACAMPAAGESASGASAAGQVPGEPAAASGGTAIGGASGSGGQGAGADLRDSGAGQASSAGLDRVGPESAGGRDWNWLALPILIVLVVLAALRVRYELRRQRREARREA